MIDYAAQKRTHVRTGARWAIGIGAVMTLIGVASIALFVAVAAAPAWAFLMVSVFYVGVGAYTVRVGWRLRDPSTATSAQFTRLVWIYGTLLALSLVGDAVALIDGEPLTGLLRYALLGWALVAFGRGGRCCGVSRRSAPPRRPPLRMRTLRPTSRPTADTGARPRRRALRPPFALVR